MVPVVRVADVTHKEIQRAADAGAQGIIVPGLREVSEFSAVVERIKRACRDAGRLCTTFAGSPAEAKMEIERGMDAVGVGLDSAVFAQAYKALVDGTKG